MKSTRLGPEFMTRLLAALGATLALGCNVVATNQPLTVTEQGGASGGAGTSGQTGAAGTADPRCCTEPSGAAGTSAPGTGGAAGTSGVNASGSGGIGAAGTSGVNASGNGGAPCWESQLPPEPQAPQPTLSTTEACAKAGTATSWTFPMTGPQRNDDQNGLVVGRWVPCGPSDAISTPHEAIEFSGNGRWQLLGTDASGRFVPLSTRGSYYLDGSGQLNLAPEAVEGARLQILFVTFADGNRDILGLKNDGPLSNPTTPYARIAPSPANGDENAPPVSDGHCSMVGSWNVPANNALPFEPASVWSFDGAGHFVVDATSADLCGAQPMWGTYELTGGLFEITQNWNVGLCDWMDGADFPYTFSADCSAVMLTEQGDNCTGGRGYLNGQTTLTRLP
jgi:hypothetical protein